MTASADNPHRLIEALVFASSEPVTPRQLAQLLPDLPDAELALREVAASYAERGVRLVEVAGGWQFRTAPELAPLLRRVVPQPRRLPRAAMEVLAVVAYHQPITRPEIEERRGAALSQQTLELLLEEGLIASQGRKEVPGRPTLWGTTPAFLGLFGLRSLRDLPRREDLLIEPAPVVPSPAVAPDAPSAPDA